MKLGELYRRFFCGIGLVLFLTACGSGKLAPSYSILLTLDRISHLRSVFNQPTLIEVDESQPEKKLFRIISPITHEQIMAPWEASEFTYRSFQLKIPDLAKGKSFLLTRSRFKPHECFYHREFYQIEVCLSEINFNIHVSWNGLTQIQASMPLAEEIGNRLLGNHAEPSKEVTLRRFPQFKQPRKLTLEEAVQMAFQRNPELLEERLNLVRAKQAAKSAYLGLLPRFNFYSTLSMMSAIANPSTPNYALAAIGDIAPMLLPNRWLKARELQWQGRAANMSALLVHANMASAIHILGINYLTQRDLVQEMKKLEREVLSLLNFLPPSTNIGLFANDLQGKILSEEEILQKHTAVLAKTIGLNHPSELLDIDLDQESASGPISASMKMAKDLSVYDQERIDYEIRNYSNSAQINSFESWQFYFLKRASELEEANLFVNWLDPQLGMNHIGFDVIPELLSAKTRPQGFEIKIADSQRTMGFKISELAYERNLHAKQFSLCSSNLAVRQKLFQTALEPLQRPLPSASNPLLEKMNFLPAVTTAPAAPNLVADVDKLKGTVDALIGDLKAQYALIAVAKIEHATLDRLAFFGFYESLLKKMPEEIQVRH